MLSPCCRVFYPCRSRGALQRGKGSIESAFEGASLPSACFHQSFTTFASSLATRLPPRPYLPLSLGAFAPPVFVSLHSSFAPSPPLFAPSPYLFAHSHPFFRSPPPHLPIRASGSPAPFVPSSRTSCVSRIFFPNSKEIIENAALGPRPSAEDQCARQCAWMRKPWARRPITRRPPAVTVGVNIT